MLKSKAMMDFVAGAAMLLYRYIGTYVYIYMVKASGL